MNVVFVFQFSNSLCFDSIWATIVIQWFTSCFVFYQFKCCEQTNVSSFANTSMFFNHFVFPFSQISANFIYMVANIVFQIVVNCCITSCASQCMTTVGQTALQYMVFKIFADFFAHYYAAQWNVTAGNTFSECDDIWYDIKVLPAEHFTGTTETSHNFVADHQDAVFVAQSANAFHVSFWWNQNAVSTCDGFHHDSCYIVCTFIMQLFF